MLVLSRKIGQRIVLPEIDVCLTVIGIRSNRVQLGIDGPEDVAVYRGEIWKRIGAPDGPSDDGAATESSNFRSPKTGLAP